MLFLDTSDFYDIYNNTIIYSNTITTTVTTFICTIWYNKEYAGDKINILTRNIVLK